MTEYFFTKLFTLTSFENNRFSKEVNNEHDICNYKRWIRLS